MEKYTDQTFFYKQTPVNYDGIAKFTSIKGNTLGWNQLVKNGNFANGTTDWYGASATISASNGVCRATIGSQAWNNDIRQNMVFVPNHKFLFSCDYRISSANVGELVFTVGDSNSGTTRLPNKTVKTRFVSFLNPTDLGTSRIRFSTASDQSSNQGEWYEVSNVYLIDLTQMGLDSITSVDEFTSLFPLPYYDYNQGTLIPFSGNGIKTTGKNLLPLPIAETKNGITLTHNGDGSITLKGTATALVYFDFSTNFDSSKYEGCLFTCITPQTAEPGVLCRISQSNRVGIQDLFINTEATVQDNGEGLYFAIRIAIDTVMPTDGYTIYPMLRMPNQDSTFEPYTSSTLSLPISTYFPTGMKRAGSVYDELTENKAITRIGAVEMSSLSWTMPTSGVFQVYKSDAHVQPKVLSAFFKYFTNNFTYGGAPNYEDGTGGVNPNNQNIYYKDSAFTSVDALKSAMQGFYLYYELATPTETDAEDIFYKFYGNGTEEILPVNGSSPETSPIIADIEYYDSTEGDSLYRRFWLINGDGERWDLTDKEFKSFLNNPTGLGFRKTIEVTRYGEKANKNNEVYDFPQPSGELLFYDTYNSTRYDKYNKFIRFLMSQPITLYYMIPVSYISGIANIFTLDCDVTEVQKTESKTDHILTSSIVFNGLGFYEGDEISINGTTNTYTLTNEGDFPVGFEITVEGSLTKPYITLSQDGELYGEAKFDSETAFNSLYLNSNDGEQNIILQQGGSVIPNPLSYQDLSISNGSIYVTFVKLAKGVSELSIGMESGSITNVNIKYSPKYRSV